jgi:hypothetical protein
MQPVPNSRVQPTHCAISDAREQPLLSLFTQSLAFPEWNAPHIGLVLNLYTKRVDIE